MNELEQFTNMLNRANIEFESTIDDDGICITIENWSNSAYCEFQFNDNGILVSSIPYSNVYCE